MKRILHLLVAVILILTATTPALAEGPGYESAFGREEVTPEGIVADVFLVRPVGIVATAAGLVTAIVATPFALASGSMGRTYEKLVAEPWSFTFCRPLGSGL